MHASINQLSFKYSLIGALIINFVNIKEAKVCFINFVKFCLTIIITIL